MLAIEPRGHHCGDEELGAIGVWSSVGHREQEWAVMAKLEVLIRELLTPDGASTSTIAAGEVTTLKHELRNHTVELAVLVVFALGATGADGAEDLGGLGNDIIEELEVDATRLLLWSGGGFGDIALSVSLDLGAEPLDVEVNLRARHGFC